MASIVYSRLWFETPRPVLSGRPGLPWQRCRGAWRCAYFAVHLALGVGGDGAAAVGASAARWATGAGGFAEVGWGMGRMGMRMWWKCHEMYRHVWKTVDGCGWGEALEFFFLLFLELERPPRNALKQTWRMPSFSATSCPCLTTPCLSRTWNSTR